MELINSVKYLLTNYQEEYSAHWILFIYVAKQRVKEDI